MARSLRLVHTSDIHLDAYRGSGESVWEERRILIRESFQRVIALTRTVGADALLVVGDVFDSNRVDHETAEWFLDQCATLAPTPVIAINGNHDALGDGSVYDRHDVRRVENLYFLLEPAGSLLVLEELDLVCWGRGYHDTDWEYRPLAGLPERMDGRWHVALAHGHLFSGPSDAHRSMLIEPEEIAASGWDYIALGHWERHYAVSQAPVAAAYSGAPMPLSLRSECGGGVLVVDCESGRGVRWRRISIDGRPQPAEGPSDGLSEERR